MLTSSLENMPALFQIGLFRRATLLPIVGLYAALLATMLLYWPGLNGGFLLDDYENLRRPLTDLDRGTLSWKDTIFTLNAGPLGRPIAMLSFIVNMVASGPDVWMFKFTNLMIHLLCGVLIFWLTRELFAKLRPNYSSTHLGLLALLVATLWLFAPLLVSTTLYLVQRMTQLATLFSLCALLSYMYGRKRIEQRPITGWSLILSSLIIWMPLAALSKENGLLVPLLLFVLEIFIFGFAGNVRTRRGLIVFFTCSLGVPVLIALLKLFFHPSYFLASYAGRPFTLVERVLTEARVLFFYLGNLLVPQGSGMGLFHDDFVISKGLITPPTTLLSILGWTAILAAAMIVRNRIWQSLLFGLCFFLAAHALESTIFPLELVFEHRNYLPAFGVFFSLVVALDLLLGKVRSGAPIVALMMLLPLAYGFATYQRADTWSSWDKILLSAEVSHPNSPRVHIELASLYSAAKNFELALEHLDRLESLRPSATSGASLHRIIVYCNMGLPIPRRIYERIPNKMATDDAGIYAINALRGINQALHRGNCPQLDISSLVLRLGKWIANAPKNNYEGRLWDIHYETAHLLQYTGRTEDAITHLKRAHEVLPDRPEALLVMLRYELDRNNLKAARLILAKIREAYRNPSHEQSRIIAGYDTMIERLDSPGKEGIH